MKMSKVIVRTSRTNIEFKNKVTRYFNINIHENIDITFKQEDKLVSLIINRRYKEFSKDPKINSDINSNITNICKDIIHNVSNHFMCSYNYISCKEDVKGRLYFFDANISSGNEMFTTNTRNAIFDIIMRHVQNNLNIFWYIERLKLNKPKSIMLRKVRECFKETIDRWVLSDGEISTQ